VFDWTGGNARKIWQRHRVRTEEAEEALLDPGSADAEAYDAEGEHREAIIGMTGDYRLLYVVYTERGNLLRVVSARDATRFETELYRRR